MFYPLFEVMWKWTFVFALQAFIERFFWAAFLSFVIFNISRDTPGILRPLHENNVSTVILLRPTAEIPFPGVVINTGGAVNPLGAVENSLAAVGEGDMPAEGNVEMSEYVSDQ